MQESYGRVPGVAAATILGDGQIALILDPNDLVQNAIRRRSCYPAEKGFLRMSEPSRAASDADTASLPRIRNILSFRIEDNEYSVEIMSVREIRGWTRTTSLPHAPPFVRGVINLRGTVLPVVDLAVRLGLDASEPRRKKCHHRRRYRIAGHGTAGGRRLGHPVVFRRPTCNRRPT